MLSFRKLLFGVATPVAALAGTSMIAVAHGPPKKPDTLTLGSYGVMYAGGEYVPASEGSANKIKTGQIQVEYFLPAKKSNKLPVIMIHGAWQTGVNFLTTPDGREGWALDFVRQGYPVYVIDQPARGRSTYHPSTNGPLSGSDTGAAQQRFTAPEKFPGNWPQAKYHTQWPGTGLLGDQYFDQFFASQVENAGNGEALTTKAVSDLLDKIGPAIVMTHSQSGAYTWPIADARPKLVKAILAVEPSGPPVDGGKVWGVSSIPLTYSPPVSDPSQLQFVEVPADNPDLLPCKRQKEPARKLVNLRKIPVLEITGQASYHAQYDQCTARYLQQAGVPVDFVRLETVGLRGNGHMIMLEKNSADVAKFMMKWLDKNLKPSHGDYRTASN
jgi:pimeloyl-ACP methyl ester carboxylesterase